MEVFELEAGDVLRLRLLADSTLEPSSTVTGLGFRFDEVAERDCRSDDADDPALSLDGRRGLALAGEGGVESPAFCLVDSLSNLGPLAFFRMPCVCASASPLFSSSRVAWLSAVSGGLGGPFMAGAFRAASCLGLSRCCRSVGSGVSMFFLGGVARFSLLFTASLLCALEKDGYGRLVRLPFGEMDVVRRCSSGTGMDVCRRGAESPRTELRSSAPVSSSSARSFAGAPCLVLPDLCRRRSLGSDRGESRSPARSLSLEGITTGRQSVGPGYSGLAESEGMHEGPMQRPSRSWDQIATVNGSASVERPKRSCSPEINHMPGCGGSQDAVGSQKGDVMRTADSRQWGSRGRCHGMKE